MDRRPSASSPVSAASAAREAPSPQVTAGDYADPPHHAGHGDIEILTAVARSLTAEFDLRELVQRVTDAGTQLTGAQFGAYFYNTTDEHGESYRLYTLSGAPAEEFAKLGMPRNTALFAPTFRGERAIRIDDVRSDPRYGQNAPHGGLPDGHLPVRSYLAVPVVARSGEVLGGLFFGHGAAGVFTERAERLALGLAAQAAIALENASLHQQAQREIEERKRIEQSLRESEQRYRQLVQRLPAAVYTCDALGRIRLFNAAAVKLWGRTPQIGDEWWCGSWRIYRPDGTPLPQHECPMAVALKEGRAIHGEEIIIEQPDGTRRNIVAHPEPIFDAAGRLAGAVNMLVDVTEEHRADETKSSVLLTIESSQDAIVSKTLDGIITSWNAGAEVIFGYTAEEAVGEHITLIIPDERRSEEDDIIRRLRNGQRIEHYETQRVGKGGRRVEVSVNISPLRDAHGVIIGAAKVARDITAQKRSAVELTAIKDDLAVQVEALKRLHELSLSLASSLDLNANLAAILKTAIVLHTADMGSLSLANPATGSLEIAHTIGFDPGAFGQPECPPASACAAAAATGQRVVVEDFETDERFMAFRDTARSLGFRAAHSTPIVDRAGNLLGVLAVQFRAKHRPTVREMQFADMCARYAHGTIEAARHQQELRASEQRFRILADTAPAMLWVTNPQGVCTFQSRAWYNYTGQEEASALGTGWLSAVHPDDRDGVTEVFRTANIQRQPFSFDYRLRRFDGEYRWAIDAGHPRFDSAGAFLGYIGSVIDIHDRKQAEDALRDSEEKFRNMADNMSQFAWMTDANGWIFWYNRRWFEYTGTTLADMQGWGWTKVHHPDHLDRVVAKFCTALRTGEPWEDTFPLRGRDGQFRWFLSRAMPIRDEEGQIIRWFGTNTDITERKEAEQQLRFVMAELNHRVKNTLATIDAVAHQTIRHSASLEEFQTAFSQRLRAFGQAHSLLTQTHWEGASLYDLIQRELRARCGHDGQMDIHGPMVVLRPKAALALHMVIHELCTNAAKYGALCSDAGKVKIEWTLKPGLRHEELHLNWCESGGPPVSTPTKRGFGSRVLESTIAYELEGKLELEFRRAGLVCVIVFPLREESGYGRAAAGPEGKSPGPDTRHNHA